MRIKLFSDNIACTVAAFCIYRVAIPDFYLKEVEARINNGTAIPQDYQYQDEIKKRKKDNLSGKEENEIVQFIQGIGSNAKKIVIKLPKGFKKTNLVSHGQKVYSDVKRWITPDKDGHNGGVWKVYDNPNDVGKNKKHRDGTYDSDLNKIGN